MLSGSSALTFTPAGEAPLGLVVLTPEAALRVKTTEILAADAKQSIMEVGPKP